MSALVSVLTGLAIGVAIWVGAYVMVYTVAARRYGFRLWSRRRARAWWLKHAECVGGPFDGTTLPASRLALVGWTVGTWPDVIYDATTRQYRIDARRPNGFNPRHCWAGCYALRFLSDRYEWHGTGVEQYADRFASLGGAA